MIKQFLLVIPLGLVFALPLRAQTNALLDGVTVTIDPVVALTNYTSLGEWNTDGNFDNWSTAQVSGATVSAGLLSGAASSSDPQITLIHLGASGPDLDLAFNDYLDVRLQLPAGSGGTMQVYFG
ncbi:MAG TPA: hypothetical protein VHC44_03400, partial [Verrucomicrobiae bacterium]|nr:hypothetical protein [Verrucomicrobiae bacterium]